MLLLRLREYAEAGRVEEMAPEGYLPKAVRYVIELDATGRMLGIVDQAQGQDKQDKYGRLTAVPEQGRTSLAIKPRLFADDGEYTLGKLRVTKKTSTPARVRQLHEAYAALVQECAVATEEPAVGAIVAFLASAGDANSYLPEDFDPNAIITFRVAGVLPIELPAVRRYWARRLNPESQDGDAGYGSDLDSGGDRLQCIVCGQLKPALKRLAYKWKGIHGGQSGGLALISAEADAFKSYGLENSLIAPTCAECGELFSKAANDLLANDATRLRVGPLTYIFWTREEVGFNFATLVTDPQPQQVSALLQAPQRGRQAAVGIDGTPFYAAAFSASGGRVVVRDWLDTTVGEAQQHLRRYFQLQQIVEWDGADGAPLPLIALAVATVRESKNIIAQVPQAILSVAIRGGMLPQYVLLQVVQRCRAEQRVRREHAALIKMVLLSQLDWERQVQEGRMAQLVQRDAENREPSYLCGRLLAILEEAQRAALGPVNATIIDRYIGTASSAPASVFGRLLTGAQAHLSTLRRDWPAKEQALQRQLEEAQDGLYSFPRTLSPQQQGLFMLGYYHQRAADRAERASARRAAAERAVAKSAEVDSAPEVEH